MNDSLIRLELEKILSRQNITSVFQPIVNVRSKKILGFEALTRGPSDSPLHSPEQLFQAATRLGRLPELELLCREKSIDAFIERQFDGLLFINISPMALLEPNYPKGETIRLVEETPLSPNQIVIEVSEKYPTLDIGALRHALNYYRSQGFRTAIDDLGAGYSDLRLWSELRPNFVKIDRHFISSIDRDSVKREFIKGISDIAKSLGCEVIAEGIETEDEMTTVKNIGIEICQGYYIAKPSNNPPVEQITTNLVEMPEKISPKTYYETIQSLCQQVEPLNKEEKLANIWELFQNPSTHTTLPVVDQGKVLGLIHKSRIMELFSTDYGRALHFKKPVGAYVLPAAIIVDKETSLEQVSELLTNEDESYVRQYFVITHNDHYIGMGSTRQLLKKITTIKLNNARYANPLTMLPGNVPINQHIEQQIKLKRDFYLAYFDIDNFKPFNDVYGYSKGDQVIQTLANIILENSNPNINFVGHVGGDDFIVIFQESNYHTSCQQVIEQFNASQHLFYSEEHIKQGELTGYDRYGIKRQFPLAQISVGIVKSDKSINSVEHYSALASEAKKRAKQDQQRSIHEYNQSSQTKREASLTR
ncbi:GGDEF domain-containing protein [Aliikangiella maris]|uniref:GGDEF domain-containing protein n=2 Tax=Aliikangiella maris TaxID=3162458 RepID=A0ABV3MS48_9GAMM